MRDLEFQSVQDQLDRQIVTAAAQVKVLECLTPGSAAGTCRLDSESDFQQRLSLLAARLGYGRLLLLDRERYVVYDSGSADTLGMQITTTPSKRFANVLEARFLFQGDTYVAAAMRLPAPNARIHGDPLGAQYVVLAQPQSLVISAAAGDIATRLLEAGSVAMVVAILLILIVSRSLTKPLTQLAAAAEDIAAGNYSRRVGIKGQDEIGLLGAAFDRMAEAVERARRVQREFLANVSHELKTPLTSLIGFSHALVDGSLLSEADRTRAATIVHEESERVLRMAQELLDLARVESGSMSLHITAVDLGGQLQQELEMMKPRAGARKLSLVLNVPDDIPPVAADPERLHQIIDNLLDNAVKYAPEGSIITAVARLSGGSVESVVSNPIGPHRPDPDRMFDRFYRADPSRSTAAGGVGLGLSISRELAAAMKGRLWADFDDSACLRLHLTLPAARQAASATPSGPPAAREESPGSRSAA